MTKEETLAYIAGIIDGEGYVCIVRMRPTKKNPSGEWIARIGVKMTDEAPVRLCQTTFGGSLSVFTPKSINYRRQQWCWSVTAKKAASVIIALLPYLQIKGNQGLLCIQLDETKHKIGEHFHNCLTQDEIDARHRLWLACSLLNQRGKVRGGNEPWPKAIARLPRSDRRTICKRDHPCGYTLMACGTKVCRACRREHSAQYRENNAYEIRKRAREVAQRKRDRLKAERSQTSDPS
jgi:hypothetical protein